MGVVITFPRASNEPEPELPQLEQIMQILQDAHPGSALLVLTGALERVLVAKHGGDIDACLDDLKGFARGIRDDLELLKKP